MINIWETKRIYHNLPKFFISMTQRSHVRMTLNSQIFNEMEHKLQISTILPLINKLTEQSCNFLLEFA